MGWRFRSSAIALAIAATGTCAYGAGFWRELGQRPGYDYTQPVRLQRDKSRPMPEIASAKLELLGSDDAEYWVIRVIGKFLAVNQSLLFQSDGEPREVRVDPKTGAFRIDIPVDRQKIPFDLLAVNVRGNIEKSHFEASLEQLPVAASKDTPPRWLIDGKAGIQVSFASLTEAGPQGTTGTAILRLPKVFLEVGARRARLSRLPAWKLAAFGSLEFSLPGAAYGFALNYPLEWGAGLRLSREKWLGRALSTSLSPFLQLERLGMAYSTAYQAVILSEPQTVLLAADFHALWASLGVRVERVIRGRNCEFLLSAGRSFLSSVSSSQGSLDYGLGGYLIRASLRTEATRRIWVEGSGQFITLSGANPLSGLGFGLGLGLSF